MSWARLEQLERMRREGSADPSLIPSHTFSSAKPWVWCFRQSVDECAGFWRCELEDPGGLVESGATTLASVVGGDALVKGDNISALGDRCPKARPKRPRHQHNAGDDGFLATNRSGYSLCPGWQGGSCTDNRTKGWCKRARNVNDQQLTLREASGLGRATIARRERAKVAAKVATSLDYLYQRRAPLARPLASSASTTFVSSFRPGLFPRRLRASWVFLKLQACSCLLDLQSRGASWTVRCARRSRHVV